MAPPQYTDRVFTITCPDGGMMRLGITLKGNWELLLQDGNGNYANMPIDTENVQRLSEWLQTVV